MRTSIPADFACPTDALAPGRGGSTIPTRASSSRSVTSGSRSAPGSKAAGSKSLRAVAMTRRPSSANRWLSARYRSRRRPASGTGPASGSSTLAAVMPGQVPAAEAAVEGNRAGVRVQHRGGPGQELIGRPLHEAADHRLPRFIGHLVELRHELVLGVEGRSEDLRVYLPG